MKPGFQPAVLMVCLMAQAAEGSQAITPCKPDTAESREAEAALERLAKEIDALSPDSDAGAVRVRLNELYRHRCFEMAALEEGELGSNDALALRRWWKDGGYDWLSSYLNRQGTTSAGDTIIRPPGVRKTLTRESAPKHPLRRLLCPAADEKCGLATRGWRLRAERAFEGTYATERLGYVEQGEEQGKTYADCREGLERVEPAQRYTHWRKCIEGVRVGRTALPLGNFRAPDSGWLLVSGRRGHYHFCDELRAYHLETGAAYIAKSCSGLALHGSGQVDHGRTDANRKVSTRLGRLPVEALREAAWMIFLVSEAEHGIRLRPETIGLPEGIELRMAPGHMTSIGLGSFWGTSSQTRLTWRWLVGSQVVAQGHITWPNSSDAADSYATHLLWSAELAFEPGRPPAKLPVSMPPGAPDGVSSVDATRQSLESTQLELYRALVQASRAPN
jgi:hypothetical protein